MAEIGFNVDTTIYNDREVLSDTYSPPKVVGRNDVLKQYQNALLPVINGEEPDDIFVYGKSGTGKTECTHFILNQLESDIEEHNVPVDLERININCEGISSSYSLAIEIINSIRPMEDEISNTGYKEKRVYKMLFNELDAIGGTVILVLDELDAIDHEKLNGFLYQIPRARTNGYLENAKVGIVGISNDLTLLDDLKSDVKSSLSDKSIQFDPYDSPELFDVLKQRSDDAFLPGAVDDGILRHCAAIGADNGGDARKAIDMLRESADISRAEDADEVLSDHVRRAKEQLQSEEVITSISSLSQNEKITLYALVTLTADGSEKPRSRRVYERYEKLAESGGERSVRYRTVRDYLAELDTLQITNRDGENGGPDGNYRTHELNEQVSVEEAVNELSGVIKICGVHTSIEDVPTAPDTL